MAGWPGRKFGGTKVSVVEWCWWWKVLVVDNNWHGVSGEKMSMVEDCWQRKVVGSGHELVVERYQ